MPVNKKNTKTQNATPAPEPVAVVQEPTPAPVVAKAKGGKKAPVVAAPEPVVAAPEPVTTAPAPAPKRGGGKKAAAPVEPVVAPAEPVAAAPVKAKRAAPKKKVEAEAVKEEVKEEEVVESEDSKTRSFKVLLPNETEYTGRFTGLTPYQAANKALSKYFRSQENINLSDNQVAFSIKESTRNSKRYEYHYRGSRIKLDTPITYTIKSTDGAERVITKQYKNQLVKVKKSVASEPAAAAPALA
jgi:hypothetical protein